MTRVGAGIVLAVAATNPSFAQDYCEQVKQAVAQYGYAAARRDAVERYTPQEVRRPTAVLPRCGCADAGNAAKRALWTRASRQIKIPLRTRKDRAALGFLQAHRPARGPADPLASVKQGQGLFFLTCNIAALRLLALRAMWVASSPRCTASGVGPVLRLPSSPRPSSEAWRSSPVGMKPQKATSA